MFDEPSVRASIDRVRFQLREPVHEATLDACAAELTMLGSRVTSAIEAAFSAAVEPSNAA